jgi:copper chaperone CopZ
MKRTKKTLIAILVTVGVALGVATYAAGAGAGCCTIPRQTATSSAASEKVATLHIEGMTCGSCATAVKRVLTRVDGVRMATVSYEKKSAVVTYDPAKVTPGKIAHAVEETLPTYKAKVIQ